MALENNIQTIRDFLLGRYKKNLAAILIFGSANTNHFIQGKSDIDHMIFLKKLGQINIEDEIKFLYNSLKSENFASQYFNDLKGLRDYIKNRKSFSTYITVVSKDGSRIAYTTPEFEKTREYLRKHPLTKTEIQEQVREKDEFELEGYFKKISGYDLTKALMSHLRRKLQIMNYFQTDELVFDYEACLNNAFVSSQQKEMLERLYHFYKKRENMPKGDIDYYTNLAKEFTDRIVQASTYPK